MADVQNYEFAFHVLPTVAEGEVEKVFSAIKAEITKIGGVFGEEESPKRIQLAYEIVKYIEGKNRKFGTAYFGWVRFSATPEQVPELTEELQAMNEILRSIMIRLTRKEEENPFFYHQAAEADTQSRVTTISDDTSDTDSTEESTDDTVETSDDESDAKDSDDAVTK
jgi:ribosomal protein S6